MAAIRCGNCNGYMLNANVTKNPENPEYHSVCPKCDKHTVHEVQQSELESLVDYDLPNSRMRPFVNYQRSLQELDNESPSSVTSNDHDSDPIYEAKPWKNNGDDDGLAGSLVRR
jgi:hypothetical protein